MNVKRAEAQGWIRQWTQEASDMAVGRYHRRFDNDLYRKATKNRSIAFTNALIDEAMALCRHPRYKTAHRKWSEAAEEFLAAFCVPRID